MPAVNFLSKKVFGIAKTYYLKILNKIPYKGYLIGVRSKSQSESLMLKPVTCHFVLRYFNR